MKTRGLIRGRYSNAIRAIPGGNFLRVCEDTPGAAPCVVFFQVSMGGKLGRRGWDEWEADEATVSSAPASKDSSGSSPGEQKSVASAPMRSLAFLKGNVL